MALIAALVGAASSCALTGCGVQEQAGSINAPGGDPESGEPAREERELQAVPGESTYTGGAGRTRDTGATTGSAAADDASAAAATEAAGTGPDAGAFLQRAAQASLLELRGSELAQEKADSAEVKAFADAMIEAHSAARDELQALARQKGVEMPQSLDRQAEALMRRLNELEGAEFEREYARQMGQAQQQTLQLYEDAARSAQDPQVRSFARERLPLLREHSRMSESLPAVRPG